MSRDTADTPDGEISTTEEFESALEAVVENALENGVDPTGPWECENGETYPDMEVLVSELAD